MVYQWGLLLVYLMVTSSAMNLRHQPSQSKERDANTLYFESFEEQQMALQNAESEEREILTDNIGNSSCPGSQTHFCSSNLTCCKGNNSYSCCPFKQGVCCSDGRHCCPPASHCDIVRKRCYRENENDVTVLTEWHDLSDEPLTDTTQTLSGLESVVCPGGELECADGQTCCQDKSGGFECCPYSDAMCCSDGKHCCPHNYVCNYTAHMCTPGPEELLGHPVPQVVLALSEMEEPLPFLAND